MFTIGIEKLKIDPVNLTDYEFGEEKKFTILFKCSQQLPISLLNEI
jgi:hypothetical protein